MTALSRNQVVLKAAVASKGAIVAARNREAAEIGTAVLESGGDAVDAAVATSFALGVLEPWISGPAGGGAMVVWRAEEAKAYSVYYGMRSPAGLDPAGYPLSASGTASDLFPWRSVIGDRNVEGATAIAVPGTVDGIRLAHSPATGSDDEADGLSECIHPSDGSDAQRGNQLRCKRNHVALGRCGGRETRGRCGMTGRVPADLWDGARARISSSNRGYNPTEKEQRE